MKRIILILALIFPTLLFAQKYAVENMPVCWNVNGVDSSITRYVLASARGTTIKVLTHLNASAQKVNVIAGTLTNGYCECQNNGGTGGPDGDWGFVSGNTILDPVYRNGHTNIFTQANTHGFRVDSTFQFRMDGAQSIFDWQDGNNETRFKGLLLRGDGGSKIDNYLEDQDNSIIVGRTNQVTIAQRLGAFGFSSLDTSINLLRIGAIIDAVASESWTEGNTPTELQFYTTGLLDTTPKIRLTVRDTGRISFNDYINFEDGIPERLIGNLNTNHNTTVHTIAGTPGAGKVIGIDGAGTSLAWLDSGANTIFFTDTLTVIATKTDLFISTDKQIVVVGSNTIYKTESTFICDGISDEIQIEAAFDTAVVRGINKVILAGDFLISDTINIKSTYNFQIIGVGNNDGRAKLETISTWDADTPVFYFDFIDTLDKIEFRNIFVNSPISLNTSGPNKGIFSHNKSGRIENVTYENVKIIGTGGYNVAISHSYADSSQAGTVGKLIIRDCDIEMLGTGLTGIYCVRTTNQVDNALIEDNKFITSGVGGNNFNVLALYGQVKRAVVTDNYLKSEARGHSPLAISPGEYVSIIGNTAINQNPHTSEAGIEVEKKRQHGADYTYTDTTKVVTIVGNLVEVGENPLSDSLNYGILVTDRDVALPSSVDTLRPTDISISANVVRFANVGIETTYAKNVILSGNVFAESVGTNVSFGRTDRGDTELGATTYNNFEFDGKGETMKMYDKQSLLWDTIISQLPTLSFSIGNIIDVSPKINEVKIGALTRPVELTTFEGINQIIGLEQTSLGYLAGNDTEIHLGTTFIGYKSGQGNQAASGNNTGIGANVLTSATLTGIQNTALGSSSLRLNTTGQRNTAAGYNSLLSNMTGSNCTAIGDKSMQGNSDGSNNTAIGVEAMMRSTNASNNTVAGYLALRNNISGSRNTVFGLGALQTSYTFTAGDDNVINGYLSGNRNTGDRNVIIGTQAGEQSILDAYSDCVFIGYTVGQNNTVSNRLMIDNTNTNLPLVDGDFNLDVLTINGECIVTSTIWLDAAKTIGIFTGTGIPESTITAGISSTYHRTDGGIGTSFFVKESGTGNTGWIAK